MRNSHLRQMITPLYVVACSWVTPVIATSVTPESLKNSLRGAGAPTQEAFQKVGCTVMGVFVTEDNLRFLFGLLFLILLASVAGAVALSRYKNDPLDWSKLFLFIVFYFVAVAVIYFVVRSWFGCSI